jgi:hypothetical protein
MEQGTLGNFQNGIWEERNSNVSLSI